ncbi:hypothetical protein T484DRAFT_1833851 [Baffinella frigidus]|nr:hypothetical protein T484DRAFT_1833851 [Cryptophyta sp. CCMP2293]
MASIFGRKRAATLLAGAAVAVCLLGLVALGRSSRPAVLEAWTQTSECPEGTYSVGDSTDDASVMVSGSGLSVARCRETTLVLPPEAKPLSSLRDERPPAHIHRAWCKRWCNPSVVAHNAICESCVDPSFPGFMKQMKVTEQWAKDGFGIRVPAREDMDNLARKSLSPQAPPSKLHRADERRLRAPKQSLAMIDAPRGALSVKDTKFAVARDMWRLESDQAHLEQAKHADKPRRSPGLARFLAAQGVSIAASALSPAAGILGARRHAGIAGMLAAQTWQGLTGGRAAVREQGAAQRRVEVAAGRGCHDASVQVLQRDLVNVDVMRKAYVNGPLKGFGRLAARTGARTLQRDHVNVDGWNVGTLEQGLRAGLADAGLGRGLADAGLGHRVSVLRSAAPGLQDDQLTWGWGAAHDDDFAVQEPPREVSEEDGNVLAQEGLETGAMPPISELGRQVVRGAAAVERGAAAVANTPVPPLFSDRPRSDGHLLSEGGDGQHVTTW